MRSTLHKVWSLFTSSEKRKALMMLALVILMAMTEMLGVVSIMPFLSVLSRPDIIHEHTLLNSVYRHLNFHNERDFIITLGTFSIVIVLISSAFKVISQHLLNRFVHFQRYSISNRLLSTYLHQPYDFFLTRHSAELSKNVLTEVDQIIVNLIHPLSQLIAQGIIVIAMGLLIVIYDPITAFIIILIVTSLYGGIYLFVRKRLGHIGKEVIIANRERYMATNEAFAGIRDIKITHAHGSYLTRYCQASRSHARHSATSETLSQTPLYVVEAIGFTGLILLSLTLLFRSNDIALILPAIGMYAFSAYRMLPAAQVMYRGFARLRFASAALDNIYDDLQLSITRQKYTKQQLVPHREIRLNNISFAYPTEPNNHLFENYNLSIPANTITGIIGKSGAGKSTLMDLLLGLAQPQQGTLKIDDVTIDARNIRSWHNAIGYVPQHIYLADTSIAANIAFGVPLEAIDIQAVERAAKAAQIHDFIVAELPQGYNTSMGERGIRLSGGQRQRIGIARALYRDPPVLFMDEATSALDSQTEEILNDAMCKLSEGKTIVIITHKESSLFLCEHVIEVKN